MSQPGPLPLQGPGWTLGIGEVSGLGARWNPRLARAELLAVGDESTRICLGALVGGELTFTTAEVTGVPEWRRGSDWEGVAGDGVGRVVILRERGSSLLVASADLVLEGSARLRHAWEDDDERGLESLVLLPHGHLLAAKQRKPVTILELAPSGDEPIGVSRGPLGWAEAFEPPVAGSELVMVATWEIEDDLGSLNDLTLPVGGPLFGVSSRSRSVVELTDPAVGRPAVSVRGRWSLPDEVADGDSRAEGLLVDARLGAFVAFDSHGRSPSLYAWDAW